MVESDPVPRPGAAGPRRHESTRMQHDVQCDPVALVVPHRVVATFTRHDER